MHKRSVFFIKINHASNFIFVVLLQIIISLYWMLYFFSICRNNIYAVLRAQMHKLISKTIIFHTSLNYAKLMIWYFRNLLPCLYCNPHFIILSISSKHDCRKGCAFIVLVKLLQGFNYTLMVLRAITPYPQKLNKHVSLILAF